MTNQRLRAPGREASAPEPTLRRLPRHAGLGPRAARVRLLQLLAATPAEAMPSPWPVRLPDWAPSLASYRWNDE